MVPRWRRPTPSNTEEGIPMTDTTDTTIDVIVASPEEADDGIAEFWCGAEMMALTCIENGRLELRIDSRADGLPWRVDPPSPAEGPAKGGRPPAAHFGGRG